MHLFEAGAACCCGGIQRLFGQRKADIKTSQQDFVSCF